MKYSINQEIPIKVNGKARKARVFGYEHDSHTWMYHIQIAEYDLDIMIAEGNLIKGIDIVTNGNSMKVVTEDEKTTTK
jgi:hypothetical protein